MNKDETISRFERGREAWNAWAEALLAKRRELEANGAWIDANSELTPDAVSLLDKAKADFGGSNFPKQEDFSGYIFPGEAVFEAAKFLDGVSFAKAQFHDRTTFFGSEVRDRADFTGANLRGDARFDQAHLHDVRFEDAIFGDSAHFHTTSLYGACFARARFQGMAEFTEAKLQGELSFSEATFNMEVNFVRTSFKARAQFEQVRFGATARFDETRFTHGASFERSFFSHGATFKRATIEETATFCQAAFQSDAHFAQLQCRGTVDFSEASFEKSARFVTSQFRSDALFYGAVFKGSSGFAGAKFDHRLAFDDAIFQKEAAFGAAQFGSESSFVGTTFRGAASFPNAVFLGAAWFMKARFAGPVDFLRARFQGVTSFDNAIFNDTTSFLAIDAKSVFSLSKTSFSVLPDFIQAHFAEAPRLDDTCIKRRRGRSRPWPQFKGDMQRAARWRALKRLAIQGHDHAREQAFFKGELLERRGSEDKPWEAVYWLGLWYGWLSDFGRSPLLAFMWWALSVAGFGLLYLDQHLTLAKSSHPSAVSLVESWIGAGDQTPIECVAGVGDPVVAALNLSLHKGLLVFGLVPINKLNQIYACLYGVHGESYGSREPLPPAFSPVIPDCVTLLGFVQYLISAILLFLVLLTIRNHFRIR